VNKTPNIQVDAHRAYEPHLTVDLSYSAVSGHAWFSDSPAYTILPFFLNTNLIIIVEMAIWPFSKLFGGTPKEKPAVPPPKKLDDSSSDEESTKDKPAFVDLDPKDVGTLCEFKNLYQGEEDDQGRFQWLDSPPKDLGTSAEDASTAKYALIVRNAKAYNDSRRVLKIDSILVQSPLLKKALGGVLEGYPGVTVELDRLEFSGRFEPLIHRWAEFDSKIKELQDLVKDYRHLKKPKPEPQPEPEPKAGQKKLTAPKQNGDVKEPTKKVNQPSEPVKVLSDEQESNVASCEHAELLQDVLVKEFKDVIDSSQDMKVKGVMTFKLLWTLFQPEGLVYTRIENQDRILKMQESWYDQKHGRPVFCMACKYVDFDGTKFGTIRVTLDVSYYAGTRSITSLIAFPLSFHKDPDTLKEQLLTRGAKFESLAGPNYKAYNGLGWKLNDRNAKEKYAVKGRIIIDTYGWNRFNVGAGVYVTPLRQHDEVALEDRMSDVGSDSEDDYEGGYEDDGGMPVDGAFADEEGDKVRVPLTEEQKLMATHLIRGYSLKEKMWCKFILPT
jgi:hypothetical protein